MAHLISIAENLVNYLLNQRMEGQKRDKRVKRYSHLNQEEKENEEIQCDYLVE